MNAPTSSQVAELARGAAGVPQPARPRALWPLLIPIAAALVGAIVWLSVHAPDGVGDLPPAKRAALVERAVWNLREVCGSAGRPREFCRDQAKLVVHLPECGPECRALAEAELATDTATR